jgi:UDP-glucose:(glucosyl)LPS alpha-1,2-glucosyltransferase
LSARIAVVLPRKEPFARDRFGAIALTAEAYVRHSRYRAETEILGMAVAGPRDAETFRAVPPRDAWWRRHNLGFAEGCADYLAKAPPRHIDVHNRVEVFFRLADRFPDAAVSLWFHNDPQDTRGAYTARQRRHILGRARHVVCVSDWVRRRFVDGVAGDASRIVVLPEGIDAAAAEPAAKEKLILYVGRIIPDKGVLALAEALARVLPDLTGWRALIVGGGRAPGDAYERQVAAALAPLGGRAALPGFLPHEQIVAELARAAIAVVPSHWQEAFGRIAIEAMAAGGATIVSRRGALPDLIGDAGLVVDEPDAASLGAAILALARDDALRADLQQRARERAVAEFDIRRWAPRLDDLRD